MPLVLVLYGCSAISSVDSASESPQCGESGCFQDKTTGDSDVSEVSTGIGADAGADGYVLINPLCGVLQCDPDDLQATKCQAPSAPDAGVDTGVAGDGSIDSWPDDGGGDGAQLETPDGAQGDGGDEGQVEGGSMGAPSELPDPSDRVMGPYPDPGPRNPNKSASPTCQVTENEDGERFAQCQPGGEGVDNDPCMSSRDCAAGYACVGDTNMGVCRSYCCLNPEACSEGNYCGVEASLDVAASGRKVFVPVCIPAQDCELLPGPNSLNRCADGLICSIVRANATTACVRVGTAKLGEPCGLITDPHQSSCGEGLVCSKATNTCLALCRVDAPDACGEGVCQSGTGGIPDGYGVCVNARKRNL